MPTSHHVVRRILEVYGPQSTKQIFVHFPEARSVNHLKTDILRRLHADNHIWKVFVKSGRDGEYVWMTRSQKLEHQKNVREAKSTSAKGS